MQYLDTVCKNAWFGAAGRRRRRISRSAAGLLDAITSRFELEERRTC